MKNLKQTIHIKASREDIFNALTNPLTIELWTGYRAVMEPVPDSEFSMFEGDITGRNLQIVQDSKIKQEWYFGDQEKPSIATISLKDDKSGTRVELDHTNIPDEAHENIEYGWKHYYFEALKKFLED